MNTSSYQNFFIEREMAKLHIDKNQYVTFMIYLNFWRSVDKHIQNIFQNQKHTCIEY